MMLHEPLLVEFPGNLATSGVSVIRQDIATVREADIMRGLSVYWYRTEDCATEGAALFSSSMQVGKL